MDYSGVGTGWWAWLNQDEGLKVRVSKWMLMRRIIGLGRPYAGRLLLLLGIMIASSLFSLLQPLMFMKMIDIHFVPAGWIKDSAERSTEEQPQVHVLGFQILLLAALQAGVSLWKSHLSTALSEGLVFDLQCTMYAHLQKMSIHFYTKTKSGEVTSRFYTDIWRAQNFITSVLVAVVNDLILLAITLGLMLYIEWRLALLALVMAPICYVPAVQVGKQLRILTKNEMGENTEVHSLISETLSVDGAMLMKIFGRQKAVYDKFSNHMQKSREISIEKSTRNSLFYLILSSATTLGTVGVKWVGGYLVSEGGMTPGTLVAFTTFLTYLYAPLMSLTNVPVRVTESLVGFERVFQVLDLKVDIEERDDAINLRPEDVKGLVEYRGVSFSYDELDKKEEGFIPEVKRFWDWQPKRGKQKNEEEQEREREEKRKKESKYALTDVTFAIEPGQLVALVGASGSGKTTTSQLLPRLYDPIIGQILIDGHDLRSLTLSSLADLIGVVTQDTFLFFDTIRANLVYAKPDASEEEIVTAAKNANLHDFISSLPDGYDTVVGERGHRLSGGERQRVAIARVFLKNPKIMVLDEATSSLDSISEALIQESFAHAMKSRSSLVIAHRLSTILAADKIVVLDQGHIIETGTHEELLRMNGKYKQLYETQFKNAATSGGLATSKED